MNYGTSVPIWCQLIMTGLLVSERVFHYLFKLLHRKKYSAFKFNSCCGVFSGSGELSDRAEMVAEEEIIKEKELPAIASELEEHKEVDVIK